MLNKVQIKFFAKVSSGQGAPQRETDFSDDGIPFIRAGSLEDLLNGKEETELPKVNEEIAKEYRLKLYKPNTIVFAKSGMSALKGRIYKLKSTCYVVNHLATLELTDNAIPDYVVYTLRYFSPVKLINDNSYPSLKQSVIENYEIPFPKDKLLQLHIANLLSKAENLISQRKESIHLLDEFLKSTFLEMFGDPVRNEKGWKGCKLGDVLNIKHGFAFSSEFFASNGEYVLLTPGNYYEEGGYRDRGEKQKYYVGEFPINYLLNKGDLLIAMTEQAAGLLGSAIIIPESNKFLHNQRLGLVQFDFNKLNSRFLFFLFNFNAIRFLIHAKATGLKVRHTSPGRIHEITIGIPPISLQTQFAQIVEKTEALKTQYQHSLQELENLYGSLSQKAFKGELTLKQAKEQVLMAAEPEAKYNKQ